MWGKLLCSNALGVTDSGRRHGESWSFDVKHWWVYSEYRPEDSHHKSRVRGSDHTVELPRQFWRASLYVRPFNWFSERNQHLWRSRLNSWEHWTTCVRHSWPQRFHTLESTNTDKEVPQCSHNNYHSCQTSWPVTHWWQQHIWHQGLSLKEITDVRVDHKTSQSKRLDI